MGAEKRTFHAKNQEPPQKIHFLRIKPDSAKLYTSVLKMAVLNLA